MQRIKQWLRDHQPAVRSLWGLAAGLIVIAFIETLVVRASTIAQMIQWLAVLVVLSSVTSALALYLAVVSVKSRKP